MTDENQPMALSVLAAGMVHEVKNPLSAIHLHLQLLENQILQVENDELRDQMHHRVDVIKHEILGLNQTLQEFIQLIRSETQPIAQTGLNQIVESVVELLRPQIERQQIQLILQLGGLPQSAQIDSSFLRQVLINLLLNSIQSFEDIHDNRDRRITITTGEELAGFFLQVEDNGSGIQPEDQEKIFEPFYTTKATGSGLGLSLVRKMMIEMGGHVDLVSTPNKGTRFTLFFSYPKKQIRDPTEPKSISD
ncbi:MAG: HAMP domain-containing histidine kinase [Leptonema sp. (in: Bacteria)]|nr:HAMP domain-containing histidine kinase [Leptonema sp. (in: bacteria)]